MNIERYEVVKAGGWSLANAERARKVMAYIQSNPDIHYFVPSAPGAINNGDIKVTDYLIACYEHRERGESFEEDFNPIRQQFTDIAQNFGHFGVEKQLDLVEEGIAKGRSYDWVKSRGEEINGRLWADLLGFRFIDPIDAGLRFRRDGRLDERSYSLIRNKLRGGDRFVFPGFYGLGADGQVQTFPRDGSDVTGAVLARGVNASIYRNLTSANGVLAADPNVVMHPKLIKELTFEEYRELGNGGIKVLHKDTIIHVAGAGTPINVRHSEKPESEGTMVVDSRYSVDGEDVIGVAGKTGFVSLNIQKYGMNEEIGIEDRVLQAFRRRRIPIEYTPSGVDSISVIFSQEQLDGFGQGIMDQIQRTVRPNRMEFEGNIGLLSVVGQGIRRNRNGISQRLFAALDAASIEDRDYIKRGISITVAVDADKINHAVQAAYDAFIR